MQQLGVWDQTVMPLLESAGGIRFLYCWYASTPDTTRTMDYAFPRLTQVGSTGIYINQANYLTSMNNAFPLLTQSGFDVYAAYASTRLASITGSFPLLTTVSGNV